MRVDTAKYIETKRSVCNDLGSGSGSFGLQFLIGMIILCGEGHVNRSRIKGKLIEIFDIICNELCQILIIDCSHGTLLQLRVKKPLLFTANIFNNLLSMQNVC